MKPFILFFSGVIAFIIGTASCHAADIQGPISSEVRHQRLRRFPALHSRNGTVSFIGEVNITNFPTCAYTYCIASDLFIPSRLGCIADTLTLDCFCNKAPLPLSCAPTGPSNDENCWYDLEDWFAGVCSGHVAKIRSETMPECIQSCVADYIIGAGCITETRDCFCKIDKAALVNAAISCQNRNCTSKMISSFAPSSWRDDICLQGNTKDYDQASYDAYVKWVHEVRIVVSVFMSIICTILIVLGLFSLPFGILLIATAIIMLLSTLITVYTKL